MPSLSELQRQMRNAVVAHVGATDLADGLLPLLIGGRNPQSRLAIHRRHYEASLVAALLEKFPAVTWLTGASFMTETARAFVKRHPPRAPCIAEYGEGFPAFLGSCASTEGLPYLRSFAELEWCLAHAAIAVDAPALAMSVFAGCAAETLVDLRLVLQTGLYHLAAAWPVDELIRFHLTEAAPDRYVFEPMPVWLEIRGARGAFGIARLDAATFQFRSALARGASIGDASEAGLEKDAAFAPGVALTAIVAEGLVTAITPTHGGSA